MVGIGTAGTGVGVSMRVKGYNPDIRVVGVTPRLGVSIQGLRNPGEAYPTQLYRRESFDKVVEIAREEVPKTVEVARRAAREEGLFVGMSAGAILYVALREAERLGKGGVVIAVLPDSGDKYLSTSLFEG